MLYPFHIGLPQLFVVDVAYIMVAVAAYAEFYYMHRGVRLGLASYEVEFYQTVNLPRLATRGASSYVLSFFIFHVLESARQMVLGTRCYTTWFMGHPSTS